MNTFSRNIRPYVSLEIAAAERAADDHTSFGHLERAHVLGQASTREHVRVHGHMLVWALQRRRIRESAGQLLRLIGAAALTGVGLIPAGNTGGSNVSAVRRMKTEPELAVLIARARNPSHK